MSKVVSLSLPCASLIASLNNRIVKSSRLIGDSSSLSSVVSSSGSTSGKSSSKSLSNTFINPFPLLQLIDILGFYLFGLSTIYLLHLLILNP